MRVELRDTKLEAGLPEKESSLLATYWSEFTQPIEMIWWTGLASWEFESPLPGSLICTFLLMWAD